MRATEFLIEDKFRAVGQESKIAALIVRDCQPFLQAGGYHTPLYRGITKSDLKPVLEPITVRKNRSPKDTSIAIHNALNRYFKTRFKLKYRSVSMFATGSVDTAIVYGSARAVFPIGNFDYCWSSDLRDLFIDMPSNLYYTLDHQITDSNYKELCDWLNNQHYRHNVSIYDFQQALMSGHEVMINCDKYYSIHACEWDNVIEEVKKLVNLPVEEL